MPRDQRLYMTFPIDFHRHPKIARLSDAAFRAFVEANGESRLAESDGRIEVPDAEFMWKPEVLAELIASHPTRPVMIRDETAYVLRDYAEHQFTKADRDELSKKRADAGAKGAAARARNRQAIAEQLPSNSEQTEAEIGLGRGITTSSNEEVEPRKRAHQIPADFSITAEMRAWAADATPLVNIDAKLAEFVSYWLGVGKPMKDWGQTWRNGMLKQQGFAERDAARSPHGRPLTRTEQNMAVVAEIAAQEAAEQKGIAS